jgi:two-component system response regulator (stage 0 sporulation protein A)
METARILIAAKEEQERNQMADRLGLYPGFTVVGNTGSGGDVLRLVMEKSPDVIVCDLFLPEYDALAILDQLRSMSLTQLPKVIVVSSVTVESMIQKAFVKGADDYILKPVSDEILIRRICELMGLAVRPEAESSARRGEDRLTGADRTVQMISTLFLRIGLPAHLLGFRFAQDAVVMLLDDPMLMRNRTKVLYPAIAARHRTTAFCVERAIRHVISLTWERGIAAKYEREQSSITKLHLPQDKPTSGEFIALMAEYMRPRYRNQPSGVSPDHPTQR